MRHLMWSVWLYVQLVRFLKLTAVRVDSSISAASCTVCILPSVLNFCAIWSRLMSGVLAESQFQSMLAHRVLHVHPEDVKGDVSFSLTDQLSTDCCMFLETEARWSTMTGSFFCYFKDDLHDSLQVVPHWSVPL